MDNPLNTDTASSSDLSPGLVEFYSTQATLMLAQYRNIERLLGPTDDWTAPGTHCEVLLRDFLRAHLPSFYRVNKGFIYGRRPVGNGTKHSPEIDILVHDNHRFRPVFQIEDFVITQGRATHAAIQVKRRMDKAQLRKALKNLRQARSHLDWTCQDTSRNPLNFFSGVVFFDERSLRDGGGPSETYKNCITEEFSDPRRWHLAPDFIGTLQHHVYLRQDYGINRLKYVGYAAQINENQNIAVQLLLWMITQIISSYGTQPPTVVPAILRSHAVDDVDITGPASQGNGTGSAAVSEKEGQ